MQGCYFLPYVSLGVGVYNYFPQPSAKLWCFGALSVFKIVLGQRGSNPHWFTFKKWIKKNSDTKVPRFEPINRVPDLCRYNKA